MSDIVVGAEASTPLSQVERVLDTFIAPSKTFHDILRDTSWWLPWLLGVLVTLGFGVADPAEDWLGQDVQQYFAAELAVATG